MLNGKNKKYLHISLIIGVAIVLFGYLQYKAKVEETYSQERIYNNKVENLQKCLNNADNRHDKQGIDLCESVGMNSTNCSLPNDQIQQLRQERQKERENCYKTFKD
ncbi:hypothetical protein HYT18_02475 [Candidatus Microgenomates bacterium]|nr:hypothetical protein [Candidatus Microgenomates bacterium]